jgi:hypothetical protein
MSVKHTLQSVATPRSFVLFSPKISLIFHGKLDARHKFCRNTFALTFSIPFSWENSIYDKNKPHVVASASSRVRGNPERAGAAPLDPEGAPAEFVGQLVGLLPPLEQPVVLPLLPAWLVGQLLQLVALPPAADAWLLAGALWGALVPG